MAYPGMDAGRTGPYWRRQNRTTLPGERTGAELALFNAQLARMGLPQQGGPSQLQPAMGPPRPVLGPQPDPPPEAGLHQLPLPQLLALKAMLAQATGGRRAAPAQPERGILPQLHRVVQVRPHSRIVQNRSALAGHLPGPY